MPAQVRRGAPGGHPVACAARAAASRAVTAAAVAAAAVARAVVPSIGKVSCVSVRALHPLTGRR